MQCAETLILYFVCPYKTWKKHFQKLDTLAQLQKILENFSAAKENMIDYLFLTTEPNLKALYISLFVHNLISKVVCSEFTDFCLQLCFLEQGTFHILKHISKKNHILKMKAHSENHFETENMFLEK